jgi:enoyl-CoA hydratase/carnithine racemase
MIIGALQRFDAEDDVEAIIIAAAGDRAFSLIDGR